MAKNLVIVESPAKARTLQKYLGRNYQVKASVGHIMDLPKSKLGVDIEHDFEPEYQVLHGKKKILGLNAARLYDIEVPAELQIADTSAPASQEAAVGVGGPA